MTHAVAHSIAAHPTAPRRPLVLELVGPAGAGKTTVLSALGRRESAIRAGVCIQRLRYLPTILMSAAASLPTLVAVLRSSPRASLRAMRHLVRLRALHSAVGRAAARGYRIVALDEGPVFTLARLAAFAHPRAAGDAFDRCWESALDQCARTVDAIVWLDAPDPVLAQRIRSREKPHRVQDGTEQQVYEFLARYRRSYEQIIARLTADGGARLLTFSTATESADQIAARIAAAVDGGCPAWATAEQGGR